MVTGVIEGSLRRSVEFFEVWLTTLRPRDIALSKFEPPQLRLVDHVTLWLFDIAMENGSFIFI